MKNILHRGFYVTENGTEKIWVNNQWHTGEWKEGNFLLLDGEDCRIATSCFSDNDVRISVLSVCAYPVIPETVCSYLNMEDFEGEPLWENDIVLAHFYFTKRVKGVVKYRGGSYGIEWKRGADVFEFTPFSSMCNVRIEKIGNIFNRDLMMEVFR